MTDFPIAALRSVDLIVPDLGVAERFYTQVWGLSVTARSGDMLWLRATGRDPHVLALRAGSYAAIGSMTFRAQSMTALHAIAARIAGNGSLIRPLHVLDEPGGGTAIAVRDPAGRSVRVVHGDTLLEPEAPTRDRPERLAHVNINSDDVVRDTAFFTDILGFRLTDRSRLMAFVRTNSDHHSVVIAEAPVNTLNHVAFQQPSLEGVMRASGRMIDHGYPIAWGVGRHGPGDNVFAYFVDPSGFVIEHTAEVLQVDDDYAVGGPGDWVWPPGRTDQWGIAPPKSDTCKAAQLAIPFEYEDIAPHGAGGTTP